MAETSKPIIGIIGGTGDLGTGLAKGWASAGYKVVIGSRSREKAAAAAADLGPGIEGEDNIGAARAADIVILAVPFANHDASLEEIRLVVQGKIVVDAAVPLVPPKVSVVQLPGEGSAAQIAQRILGDGVRVVSAFQQRGCRQTPQGRTCRLRCPRVQRRQGGAQSGDRACRGSGQPWGRGWLARKLRSRRGFDFGADLDQSPVQGPRRRHQHHRS
ncbi:putative dinucleotide-binding enzyme [Sinorhizobium meliloti]